jgi:arylformamidase
MAFDWHNATDDVLEQHFNPRVAVADAQGLLERYIARSAETRERITGTYDLRYGPDEKQTFDLHPPADGNKAAPILIFIHGGYWRALDKSDHSFVVPAFTDAGLLVVNLNYDLCPTVTLDRIVEQVRDGIAYVHQHAAELGGDPARITLMGHSAGAHLAAMMLAQDWTADGLPADVIKSAVLLTGIYEPAVVQRISVNAEIQMTPDVAARNDCINNPPLRTLPLLIAAGGDEPDGWQQQSIDYAGVCRAENFEVTLTCVTGTNHFTLLDAASDPSHDLCQAIIAKALATD